MWHTEIWLHGKQQPDAELVYVGDDSDDDSGIHWTDGKETYVEPGPTLQELDVILNFLAKMFPNGWVVTNNTIVDYQFTQPHSM
jgi:hypothetical protein